MASVFALDLSGAPRDVITVIFENMDLQQRFTCALVCSDWAKAAPGATHTIVKHNMQDSTQLQRWLDKNGHHVETLQLHRLQGLARVPCAQLQDLLLHGVYGDLLLTLDSRVWSDIAAATKLTSVSVSCLNTTAQPADVASALAALPDLQRLTWRNVFCGPELELSDGMMLQQLTRLKFLELGCVAAEVLQHLSSLTKLQHLSMHSPSTWAAADYPGLQELQALTSLVLRDPVSIYWFNVSGQNFPACVSHLTALQQLEVSWATFPELNVLTVLTALTKLRVANTSPSLTPLLLQPLQHLKLTSNVNEALLHTSSLAICTQLRCLSLCSFNFMAPGSLVASSMLQELDVQRCRFSSGNDGPAAMSPWEVLFPGPARLPHLTSLVLQCVSPPPQQADVEQLVACCSCLQVLQLECEQLAPQAIPGLSALAGLSHLTKLRLSTIVDEQCSAFWLAGLRELQVFNPHKLSATGLRHLASLKQLTSLGFHFCPAGKVGIVVHEHLSDTLQDCRHALVNKAPAGSPSDVSARLLHACDLATAGGEQH